MLVIEKWWYSGCLGILACIKPIVGLDGLGTVEQLLSPFLIIIKLLNG